jgi:hypothetical protein
MTITNQEDFNQHFSVVFLKSELNKLCPGTTWSNCYNDEWVLGFEHPTKGNARLRVCVFPLADELDKPIVNMFIMSMETDNPRLDTIVKNVSLDSILDGVPLESPCYLEAYPVIAKYLMDNVFDNWLNDKLEES